MIKLDSVPTQISILAGFVGINDFHTDKDSRKELKTSIREKASAVLNTLKNSKKSLKQAFLEEPRLFNSIYADLRLLIAKTKAVQMGMGFKRIWRKSRTEKALVALNTYLLANLPERNANYDIQIQLRLSKTNNSGRLSEKAAFNFLENHTIDTEDEFLEEGVLKYLTHSSRLYITGHGAKNSTHVGDKKHSVEDLVNFFLKNAPQLKTKSRDGRRIKISLLICHSATGKTEESHEGSFALALSQALDKAGIEAEVIGRKGKVCMSEKSHKIQKLVNTKHQQPGSKFSFVTSQGVTTIKDIYGIRYPLTKSEISL